MAQKTTNEDQSELVHLLAYLKASRTTLEQWILNTAPSLIEELACEHGSIPNGVADLLGLIRQAILHQANVKSLPVTFDTKMCGWFSAGLLLEVGGACAVVESVDRQAGRVSLRAYSG